MIKMKSIIIFLLFLEICSLDPLLSYLSVFQLTNRMKSQCNSVWVHRPFHLLTSFCFVRKKTPRFENKKESISSYIDYVISIRRIFWFLLDHDILYHNTRWTFNPNFRSFVIEKNNVERKWESQGFLVYLVKY